MSRQRERRRRLRVPIRYKVLALVSLILLTAMASYLYLAVSLFRQDKLVYTFDLNSTLVRTLAAQVEASLRVRIKEVGLLLRQLAGATGDRQREELARTFFGYEADYLRLEVYPDPEAEPLVFYNFSRLEELGLAPDQLQAGAGNLDREVLASRAGQVVLENVSQPPDLALLRLAVSLGISGSAGRPNRVLAAADFIPGQLLKIFARSPTHETFMVDEQGRVLVHPQARQVITAASLLTDRLVRGALEARVDQAVRQYTGPDGVVYLGAYARVAVGNLYVFTRIPRAAALRASAELIERTVLFGIAIVLVSFLVSIFFSRLLTAPVRRLSLVANQVGAGNFDVPIDIYSRDEIGGLARSFRQMVAALKNTQAQLVRSEKMAAFGQLGAGITHEVKNPMTGIAGYTELALLKADDPEQVREFLQEINKQAKRCLEILGRFLKFARQEEAAEQRPLDINELVREAGKLVKHQALLAKVAVEVECAAELPPVMGNAGELQQVLLNLTMNAQQAMKGGGRLRLGTARGKDGWVEIRVSDTGPGIPAEVLERIFDPFFTTKPAGEGTGLGLAIAYSIIKDHRGEISVEETSEKGTTFLIRLPPADLTPHER